MFVVLNPSIQFDPSLPHPHPQLKSLTNAQPVEGCWFCLSNPTAASWLICSIANEVYLSLGEGALYGQRICFSFRHKSIYMHDR